MTDAAGPAAEIVRLRLVGPITAETDGGDIPLGGPRVRALLAALARSRGRIVSHDVLLRAVWGGAAPGVRSALRANISRLRSTALGPHLAGGRQGYALVPGPLLDVDLWRIDDVAAARTPAGPDDLAGLFTLVDVEPFAGAGESPFLAAARAEARASVRRAIMRAVDADPRHPLAPVALELLLAREPDDPELRAQHLTLRSSASSGATPSGPPSAASTRRLGLPSPIAAYLPRPEDESRLAAALRLSRLVTLVGAAGVGKSRLAIEWAREGGGSSQEHIWFCRAGGSDGSWLHELSRTVGADDATLDAVTGRMAPLRGTLIVDGLDEATDAAATALALLLSRAPGVAALVTARRPLGVPGESVHRVGALSAADARALFLLRSGLPAPDDLDALTEGLGRLPLALELAAARAAQVPVSGVFEALSPSPGSETGGILSAALTATLALLSTAQRATLERLLVFMGAFARESAHALGGPTSDVDVDALRAWSLLTDESRNGLALLRVPEILRRHLQAGTKEDRDLRAAHAGWFATRTLSAFEELTTTAAGAARQRLEAEGADIDAAFEWAVLDGDRTGALCIAAGMSWAGLMSGTQSAALALGRRAAAVPGRAPGGVEARARLGRGILSYQLGFMEEAGQALREAREFAHGSGEVDLIALAHASLAYLATLSEQGTREATAEIRAAQAKTGSLSASARAMVTLVAAQVERSRGDHDRALRLADDARTLAASAEHQWVLLMSSVVTAKVLLDARDPAGALVALRAVLTDPRVAADPISVLIATSVAAGAAAGVGADAAGARIVGAVDAIGPRYGFDPTVNEPADFERYRSRVQAGLTPDAWRDAYAHGRELTLAELIAEATGLAARPRGARHRKG